VDPACVRGVLGDYAPLLAATDSVASHTVPGEHRQHRPSKPTCSNMASASLVAVRIRCEPRQLAASTRRTLLGSATIDSTAMVDSACHDHSTGYTHRPQRLEVQLNPYSWASRSSFHRTLLQTGTIWVQILSPFEHINSSFRQRTRWEESSLSSWHSEMIRLRANLAM